MKMPSCDMFKAEVLEMPFVQDLPKREKSKLENVWEAFEEISRVVSEKGMLIPQTFAATLLGISRQRVNELVDLGGLESHVVNGVRFVTENSVVAYAQRERKAGRPHNLPVTMKESLKRSRQLVRKNRRK